MTPDKYVKHRMVMYLKRDCDPGQRRKVQYGDILVEGL